MPIKVAGVFRDTKAWWTKVAGVWREGTGVHTKVAGVWRQEEFLSIQWGGLSEIDIIKTGISGTTTCSVTIRSDGTVSTVKDTGTTPGDWLSVIAAGSGSAFETRLVSKTGATVVGPTSFTALSSNRVYSVSRSTDGTSTANFTIEIQKIGDAGSRESRLIELTAMREPGG